MSLTDIRNRTAEKMAAPEILQCSFCGKPTQRETLSQYGARCFSCYEDYCRRSMPPPRDVGVKDKDPKSWAWALKARHESGERLTKAQIDAYMAALQRGIDCDDVG